MKHLCCSPVSQICKQMWFPAPRQWGQVNRCFSLWAGPFSTNLGVTTGLAVTPFSVKGACPSRVSYSRWFSLAHFIYPEYFSWKAVCTGGRIQQPLGAGAVGWVGEELALWVFHSQTPSREAKCQFAQLPSPGNSIQNSLRTQWEVI